MEAWVGLLTTPVSFCNDTDNESLVLQLCAQAWSRDFGLLALLQTIGCSDQVIQHYQSLTISGSSQPSLDPTARFPNLAAHNSLHNFYACHPSAVCARVDQKIMDGDYGKVLTPASCANVEAVVGTYEAYAGLRRSRGPDVGKNGGE